MSAPRRKYKMDNGGSPTGIKNSTNQPKAQGNRAKDLKNAVGMSGVKNVGYDCIKGAVS